MVGIPLIDILWSLFVDSTGFHWLAAAFIGIVLYMLFYFWTEEILLSLTMGSIPIVLFIVLSYLFVSWAFAGVVLIYGYLLYISIRRFLLVST